jgi:hypothetical protein
MNPGLKPSKKKQTGFLRLVALVLLVGGCAQVMGIFGALSFEQDGQHILETLQQPSMREALAAEVDDEPVLQRRQQVAALSQLRVS